MLRCEHKCNCRRGFYPPSLLPTHSFVHPAHAAAPARYAEGGELQFESQSNFFGESYFSKIPPLHEHEFFRRRLCLMICLVFKI